MPKQKEFTLTPEQQQQVLKYMPYANTVSILFRNRLADFDDICQEAYLALCISVTMYDGKNDATFETFSSKYIVGRIQRFIKHYSHTQILSFDDDDNDELDNTQSVTITSLSKYDEDEGNLSFEETLPDPESFAPETKLNYKLLVEKLTSILNDRERKMVKCAFYIDRQSQIRLRIWNRFGLNKSRFYDIVDSSILKMAEYAFVNQIESPFN